MIGFTILFLVLYLAMGIFAGFGNATEGLIIKFADKEHPGHFEFTIRPAVVMYAIGMVGMYLMEGFGG